MNTTENNKQPAAATPPHLAALCDLEVLAEQAVTVIHRHLQSGMTERDAANLVRDWLKQHGVEEMAHRPLAWFGDRTALRGADRLVPVGTRPAWFPGERVLSPGMAVALYCAPQRDGLIAEATMCGPLGQNSAYTALCDDVQRLKEQLAAALANGLPLSAVEEWLVFSTQAMALEPRHYSAPFTGALRRYSGAVTTHRQRSLMFRRLKVNELQLPSAASGRSHVPDDSEAGLWVIQPWLVRDGLGAGFRALVYNDGEHRHWLNPPVSAGAHEVQA
ncbi:MAG: M24 family metallopeptidase [Alcanivoracaceae bacterium]|nr:M24 family metallopeptidase [Alcanivoracaceae bacterium]